MDDLRFIELLEILGLGTLVFLWACGCGVILACVRRGSQDWRRRR